MFFSRCPHCKHGLPRWQRGFQQNKLTHSSVLTKMKFTPVKKSPAILEAVGNKPPAKPLVKQKNNGVTQADESWILNVTFIRYDLCKGKTRYFYTFIYKCFLGYKHESFLTLLRQVSASSIMSFQTKKKNVFCIKVRSATPTNGITFMLQRWQNFPFWVKHQLWYSRWVTNEEIFSFQEKQKVSQTIW